MSKGLGKGLEGLFEDNFFKEEKDTVSALRIARVTSVEPNKKQPRKAFDKDALNELAASIAEHGILQPIIVRETAKDRYQIISGERRWRAARLAGLAEVPIIIKDEIDDKTALEIGLIENLQREDLNIVEEAQGYKSLIENFLLTQEQVAIRVGKSRSVITNSMRILALPQGVLDLVLAGELTSGHARALLPLMEKIQDPQKFIEIATNIATKRMTVREVENMAKQTRTLQKKKIANQNDIYYAEISDNLSSSWGRKVRIKPDDKKGCTKGTIFIEYYDKNDFHNLVELLQDYKK